MCQDSSAPLFFNVNPKIPLPDFMAALRSADEAEREDWIASKAAEEGKESECVSCVLGEGVAPGSRSSA